MKWLKRFVLFLIVSLLLIQIYRPARTNPPIDPSRTIDAKTQMSPEVAAILDRSCSDCHSSRTRWPWYSQIAPVSWLVIRDVDRGREHMSFSEWGTYKPKKAAHLLEEMSEEVTEGDMPPAIYLRAHPEARLSEADKSKLLDWILLERNRQEAANNQ